MSLDEPLDFISEVLFSTFMTNITSGALQLTWCQGYITAVFGIEDIGSFFFLQCKPVGTVIHQA